MAMQYVLSTGGQKGRLGPTDEMLKQAYAGTSLNNKITSYNGIQKFVVPATCKYRLTAIGARGAKGNPGSYTDGKEQGGFGASMSGEFHLKTGEELYMLVGQKGVDFNVSGIRDGTSGSGGGGSFITKRIDTSLETNVLPEWSLLPDRPMWWTKFRKYYYVRKFSDSEYWLCFFDSYEIPSDLKVTPQGDTGIIIKSNGNTTCEGFEFTNNAPWTYSTDCNFDHSKTDKFNAEYMATNCEPIYNALHQLGHKQVQLVTKLPYGLGATPTGGLIFDTGRTPADDVLPSKEFWVTPTKYYLFYKREGNLYNIVNFDAYWIGTGDAEDTNNLSVKLYRNGSTDFTGSQVRFENNKWVLQAHGVQYDFNAFDISAPREMLYTNCWELYQRLLHSPAKNTIKFYQPSFLIPIEPLVVAGGGNGGPDRGYSGARTTYHAQITVGTNPKQEYNSGGGFLFGATGNSSVGYSFVSGGAGASIWPSRGGNSEPGFGGGGGSTDDGDGGGGGGYYGGARGNYGASSYNVGENQVNTAQVGTDDGSIIIDMLLVKKYVLLDGESIKVPQQTQSGIAWVEVAKAPVTANTIKTHGVSTIPHEITGIISTTPKVFAWTDTVEAIPNKASIQYCRDDSILRMEKDILFTDYNMTNLLNLSLTMLSGKNSGVRCIISTDSGQSWKTYYNSHWVTVDINNLNAFWELGMSADFLHTLTAAQLQSLTSDRFRFAILGRLHEPEDTLAIGGFNIRFTIAE